MWVEFNTRVNYPVKRVLMDMVDSGDINMDDLMHKFCVSWFSICVVNVGITHLIKAWNNHTIPGQPDHHNHTIKFISLTHVQEDDVVVWSAMCLMW